MDAEKETPVRQRAAVRRIRNSGYSEAGASWAKKALKGMVPNSNSPASDINENLQTLRERCRMQYMGAPLATSAVRTNRTNVVGQGLVLKATVDAEVLRMTQEQAEAWNKQTEREFRLWAGNKRACDATGMNDFYEMQQLALIAWLLSGDVFPIVKYFKREVMRPYGFRLHLIEADRIRTPESARGVVLYRTTGRNAENGNAIFDGVEVDATGAVAAYWVASNYPKELRFTNLKSEYTRIPAYGSSGLPNVLHIMDSERPDQYRGVPYLAQIIEPMQQLKRYTEAEIMAALVQSFFTAFVTTENASEMPWDETTEPQVSDDAADYELGPGTINNLQPGEDVKFGAPTHPQTGFDVFIRALCEQMGACLELPASLLMKSFSSNYSASRGELLEAWKAFKMRRTWLTNSFCRPAYEIWMTEAVALGRIYAPGFLTDPIIRNAYLCGEWIGPSQGQLDPQKEINAAVTAINEGLSTRAAEAIKLNGSEFSQNVTALMVENEKLHEAGGGQPIQQAQQAEEKEE